MKIKNLIITFFLITFIIPQASLARSARKSKSYKTISYSTTLTQPTVTTTTTPKNTTMIPNDISPSAVTEPEIKVDYLIDDYGQRIEFYNGLFVQEPDGATYFMCGHVENAYDLGAKTNKSGKKEISININGNTYDLDPVGSSSTPSEYEFCGSFTIHAQDEDHIFNNVTLSVRDNQDGIHKKRVTIVNSNAKSATETVYNKASRLFLHDNNSTGQTEDYLSHMFNDLLYSNLDLINQKLRIKYKTDIIPDCDILQYYEDHQSEFIAEEDAWWKKGLLLIGDEAYQVLTDIDNDENLYLCLKEIEMSVPELEASFGHTEYKTTTHCADEPDQGPASNPNLPAYVIDKLEDEECDSFETTTNENQTEGQNLIISGYLKNVKVKFEFRHTANNGADLSEEGTLVIDLHDVFVDMSMNNLDVTNGLLKGIFSVNEILADDIESSWEDFQSYDENWEVDGSGFYALPEKLNEEFNSLHETGLGATWIETELETDVSVMFQAKSDLFEMIIKETTVEDTSSHGKTYSEQVGFRTTANSTTGYAEADFGFVLDDDILNHNFYNLTKKGKLYIDTSDSSQSSGMNIDVSQCASQNLPTGSSSNEPKLEISIAPIIQLSNDGQYDMVVDIANIYSVLSSDLIASVDMQMKMSINAAQNQSENLMAVDLELTQDPKINVVVLEGAPGLPQDIEDKINDTFACIAHEMMNPLEEKISETLQTQIQNAFDSMPMDLCTDIGFYGIKAHGNNLVTELDFYWSDVIRQNDSCFYLPNENSSGIPETEDEEETDDSDTTSGGGSGHGGIYDDIDVYYQDEYGCVDTMDLDDPMEFEDSGSSSSTNCL